MSETLEKVISANYLAQQPDRGPLLDPEQTQTFIQYIFDQTVLLNGDNIRRINMTSDTVEVDRRAVGRRLLRRATEAVDDHVNANITFAKIAVGTQKLRLDWELSAEAVEDSGQGFEDDVARMMTGQIGEDLEDLCINGDSTTGDPLMSTFDGWRKIAMDTGITEQATNGASGLQMAHFQQAIGLLGRRYLQQRNQLRFNVGSNILAGIQNTLLAYESYERDVLEGRAGVVQGAAGATGLRVFGLPLVEVPLMPEGLTADGTAFAAEGAAQHGSIELTFPQNRILGVKREVRINREYKAKKDTTEYTVFMRAGTAIENPEAYVILNGIQTAAAA